MNESKALQPLILVVDDNPINLRVVGGELKNSGKYRITFANSGAAALQQIEKQKPDLILLDIMMPEMSGHEVCTRLKENHETQHIPVIFLTAMGDTDDIVKGFELGGSDYITKPFTPTVLLARVDTHLQLYLSRKREQELLSKERIYAYQNGMTQMRTEILHNLGNAMSGFSSRIMEKQKMSHSITEIGHALATTVQILDNSQERQRVEQVLTKASEMLTQTLPQIIDKDEQSLSGMHDYVRTILFTLKNLTQEGFHSTTVELGSLFDDVTTLLQSELDRLQIQFHIEGTPPYPSLFLPRGPFSHAIFDIIKNSCEAIEEEMKQGKLAAGEGQITATIQRVEQPLRSQGEAHYTIEMGDNGVGILQENLSELAKKQFSTKHQGVGLGLHSASNFINSIHGTIAFNSPGLHQGASVRIALPIEPEAPTNHPE